MRISDWSSDVCSSDLLGDAVEVLSEGQGQPYAAMRCRIAWEIAGMHGDAAPGEPLHVRHRRIIVEVCFVIDLLLQDRENPQIGRASGRERVCQHVYNSVVAVLINKQKK